MVTKLSLLINNGLLPLPDFGSFVKPIACFGLVVPKAKIVNLYLKQNRNGFTTKPS